MSLLGIDFGGKRLGVAISAPGQRIAIPLKTVERKNWQKPLSQLIAEYQIKKIILGIPYSLNGQIGPQAQKALQFLEELKEAFSLPVIGQDERLSTSEAQRRLKEIGSQEKADSLSAAIILQSYLDAQK